MIKISTKKYSSLLHELYAGSKEEDPFSSFLKSAREVLNLNFSSIILRQPEGDNGGLLFVSSDFVAKTLIDSHDNFYTDRYFSVDPLSNLPFDRVVSLDEFISESELKNNEFYKLCMKPSELHYLVGIDLQNYNGKRFGVRFSRPKSSVPFSQDEKEFVLLLAPHIKQAVSLGSQLSELSSEKHFFATTVSGHSIGTITLNEMGKVLKLDKVAEAITSLNDGIGIAYDTICLSNLTASSTLKEHITQALQQQRNQSLSAVYALSVPRDSGKPDYEIIIKSLPINRNIEPKNSPHLIVFVTASERETTVSVEALVSLYNLTLSEARVTALLAEGKDLDKIASELGIRRNTARSHLREIFSKTGVKRQPMLVSMVLKSLAALPAHDGQ